MQSLFQRSLAETNSGEEDTRSRILQAALRLFAAKGYEGTTTKDLAGKANVAEGTLFRYFPNKKAILIEVATRGWVDILTDLLTELSEMGSYKAVAQVMRRRVLRMRENSDLLRVCFIEAQFHPELKERIQSEVIAKMTDVAEAFFQTAIDLWYLSSHESENCRPGFSRNVRNCRFFQ
jgi:AcrR family transcriptional regulator